MEVSVRLELPYIAAGQAQKHVTHNEAIDRLDQLVQPTVISRTLTEPPADAGEGDAYIVPAGASGAWVGWTGRIVAWRAGGWMDIVPAAGWRVHVVDDDLPVMFRGGAWGPEGQALKVVADLDQLAVGTGPDAANPFSAKLNSALWAAKEAAAGGSGDLRFVMNKEATADNLSFLLQTGYSARAEFGLLGEDHLRLKVSPDGEAWNDALLVDAATGFVGFGTWPDHRLTVAGTIAPAADNAHALGSASRRFTTVHAATGTISTSDEREKTDITDSPLGLAFIRDLKPRRYRWRGDQAAGEHHGLIAQEVAAILQRHGAEAFGALVSAGEDPERRHGLRYDGFLAPLIAGVQEIDRRLARLEEALGDVSGVAEG